MPSKKERRILEKKILRFVGEAADQLPEEKVVGFMATKGNLYNRKLMVIGRAVNGWTDNTILPSQLAEPDKRRRYSKIVKKNSSKGNFSEDARDCPMKWVQDQWQNPEGYNYNTKGSAFWRVILRVTEGLEVASENDPWSSYLVWSNLYKVSPGEEGNPGNRLCDIQLNGCKSLFDTELKIYRPSRLLLLTGWDWARDFVKSDCRRRRNAGPVEATGQRKKTSIVVAKHPQGKPEGEWVTDVLAAFN